MNNSLTAKLNELLVLTRKKNINTIKELLVTEPIETKGPLFEDYLAELYKGNGWHAVIQGGRGDAGADILLYHPETPNKVSLIIQAKNHKQKLSFDDTKIELIKFEQQASDRYECNEYCIFSINGYVERAEKLAEFNMALHEWDKIVSLIQSFNPQCKKPTLELLAHNLSTYKKVTSLFKTQQRVSCVQATGTGKSYLIAQNIVDQYPKNCLVLAPSHYILRQQERLLPGLKENITYMTYAKVTNLKKKYWEELNPAMIILDEFHRAGATQWGEGIKRLLDACPKAKIFGTTATHIRYLDNARNMVDELFDGTLANEMSLQDAIARQILPEPYYVSALYTLDDEINLIKEDIKNCDRTEDEKSQALQDADQIRIDWEASSGIPNILHIHLKEISGKYIVFCENIQHLDVMQDEVSKWFRQAADKEGARISRQQYIVESTRSEIENDKTIKLFEEAQSNKSVHLLFAVNMLNEGLHITDVNGVILLRKTISPIIYFQQIGRCFNASGKAKPVIFDLVNNIHNIQATSFEETLNEAIEKENVRRREVELNVKSIKCHIFDETVELVKQLSTLENRLGLDLDSFGKGLAILNDFIEEHGHCRVELRYVSKNGFKLGVWVGTRRREYKRKNPSLTSERIAQLEELGFEWDVLESDFLKGLAAITEFKKEHGHCRVPEGYVTKNGMKLKVWVNTRRKDYKIKNSNLTAERVAQLESLGFDWDPLESDFQRGLSELAIFKKECGHCRVEQKHITENNFPLGNWVGSRRKDYRENNTYLTTERIVKLEALGFEWDPQESYFQQGLLALADFKKEHGHCRVIQNYVTEKGFKLGGWVSHRRREYKSKNPMLSEKRISQIEALGFDWEPRDVLFDQGLFALTEFKREHGHCRVKAKYITDDGFKLGNWVGIRRSDYKSKSPFLSEERIAQLDALGFDWDPLETDFQVGLSELITFKKEYDHCRVAQSYVAKDGYRLGSWVGTLRKNYKTKNSSLTTQRIQSLEKLGFVWDPIESSYQEGMNALKAFKKENGHCRVENKYITDDGYKLGSWVSHRRKDYKTKSPSLTTKRIQALEKLGFIWDPIECSYQEGLDELIIFKQESGHCNVTTDYITKNNFNLGFWVARQRKNYRGKSKSLTPKRIAQLDALGFIWNSYESAFQKGLIALTAFKKEYGHCRVVAKYVCKDGFNLGTWVSTQRDNYKKKRPALTEKRIAQLETLEFQW